MASEEVMAFNVENLINVVHNERILWDPSVNGSEEDKELAWRRAIVDRHSWLVQATTC